jgi:5,6-dimethylbenzimidazole synthase
LREVLKVEVFEALKGRRTTRGFKPDPVSDEDINKILDAARFAPSIHNFQPIDFIIIRDKKLKEQEHKQALESCYEVFKNIPMEDFKDEWRNIKSKPASFFTGVKARDPHIYDYIMEAPVWLAVIGNYNIRTREMAGHYNVVFDTFLAVQQILIAAWALGLGSVPLTRGMENPMRYRLTLEKMLKLPENHRLMCFICLGYPKEIPKIDKKSVEEIRHYEVFGQKVRPQ